MSFDELTLDRVKFLSKSKDEVIYEVVLEEKYIDKNFHLDKGYLYSLIDSITTLSQFDVDEEFKFHVSVNIKISFYHKIEIYDRKIFFKTSVKQNSHFIFFECDVVDKNGKKFINASHTKRIINHKF